MHKQFIRERPLLLFHAIGSKSHCLYRTVVPDPGCMYPLRYICLSEGVRLRLANGKYIDILFPNIYT